MNKRLCFAISRRVFFSIGITLLVLGLAACAAPTPATPTSFSGATASNHKVELTFKTPVIAGNNDIVVKVNDAATGEPLRHANVRLKTEKRVHVETVSKDHGDSIAQSHESAKTDPHATVKIESHDDEKKKDDHDDDAGHNKTALAAASIAGEYVGQLNFPESGEWWVTVHVAVDGAEKEAAFPVTVNRDWGKFAVLSGFLSLNVAVIAVAAVTKNKSVKNAGQKETRA